jgi:hypothetical protein
VVQKVINQSSRKQILIKQNTLVSQFAQFRAMKIIFVISIFLEIYLISATCNFDIEENYATFHKTSLTNNYKNFKRECKKLYNRALSFRERAPDECFDSVQESKRFKSLIHMLDLLCHLSRHQKQGESWIECSFEVPNWWIFILVYFNQKSFHCMANVVMDAEICEEQKDKPHNFCE